MSGENEVELRARWLEKASGATSRRDAMLVRLRDSCRPGSDDRPRVLDLSGIDLSGEDLSGLDLSDYDLSSANLSGCRLQRCNLSFARLDRALLQKAVLDGAELIGASLRDAVLDQCRAHSAGLGGADLEGARMVDALLENATLSKSSLRKVDARAVKLRGARLAEADLSGARFTRADLRDGDLKSARVDGASFDLADLRGARLMDLVGFRSANWIGADIRDIDLRGAYLVRRHVEDENYLFEFRRRDRLHALIYWIWWLSSDCGRSMGRWSLVLAVVVMVFGVLYRLAGVDFGSSDGPLAPFYFSIVTLTTLGYGDIIPRTTLTQILASLEALLGYIGLGGLLSILANKMARRAE
ncbi:MAG: hypothetical protein DRI34_03125 [Deltaproteobacteria bacterium]|nr:MAG: hypothetical protein DRI34_03125 [Deltaproteobacteria bacterium]